MLDQSRGGARNLPIRGAEAFDRGAKIATKCSFGMSFCKLSFDKNPMFPPTGGGARYFRQGAVALSGPHLVPPLDQSEMLGMLFHSAFCEGLKNEVVCVDIILFVE